MPIRAFLAGRHLTSEATAATKTAFLEACHTLKLDEASPWSLLVAFTIVRLAEDGHTTDASELAARAIAEMRGFHSPAG